MRELEDRWAGRLGRLAVHIPGGSRVLDLGCGTGGLQRLLPEGCTYVGLDRPDIDLDVDRWPRGFDVVVLAGVLEYLEYPLRALWETWGVAPVTLASYAHRARDCLNRRNCLTARQLRRFALVADLDVADLGRWQGQHLYQFTRRTPEC